MKVVSAEQMAFLEKRAIEHGADADAFMQQAALGIASVITYYIQTQDTEEKVTLIAGKGNNGGDGFCAAAYLLKEGYDVDAYLVGSSDTTSELCKKYQNEFILTGGEITPIASADDLILPTEGIILDAVLGTGFKGALQSDFKSLFLHINQATVPIFSIDIPSGVNGNTGDVDDVAMVADYTIFLGLPKKGFFLKEGWEHIGKLIYVDFGLDAKYIHEAQEAFNLVGSEDCFELIPKIERSRHKYEAGFVAGYAGSKGMMGASCLSGMGALRAGAGIVKLMHLHDAMIDSSNYPELIHHTIDPKNHDELLSYVDKAKAFYLGPGIGMGKEAQLFVTWILQHIQKPIVIDADALNIMASEGITPIKQAILTPHRGEAARLFNLEKPSLEELIDASQAYVETHDVIVVLKGGPTFIFAKGETPLICTVGDPGMATAGTGDVLTGIIAGLLAQELPPLQAATLGVYLHGKAGEFAADKKTSYAMTATDLLKMMHRSWHYLFEPSDH